MAYSDFRLGEVRRRLGLRTATADLFPNAPRALVPEWLPRHSRGGLYLP